MRSFISILSCLFLAACSAISVTPIKDNIDLPKYDGLRFYPPAFYMIINGDSKGNCQANIIELPDTSRPYVANIKAWPFTSSSTQISLTDGWNLTGVNASADSTVIASSVLGLLGGGGSKKSDGKATSPMILSQSNLEAVMSPGIYKLDFSTHRWGIDEAVVNFPGACAAMKFSDPAHATTEPPSAQPGKPSKPPKHNHPDVHP